MDERRIDSPTDDENEARGQAESRNWRRVWARPENRRLVAVAAVAVSVTLVLAIASAGLAPRSGGSAAGSGAPGATGTGPATPTRTGLVARLSVGANPTFSWAPDGAHLLVSDGAASRVYDRFGKLASEAGPVEGWLDAGHLIAGDGTVSDISSAPAGAGAAGSAGPSATSGAAGTEVIASGHGSAAIVTSSPAGCGDPTVDWFRDGKYVKVGESVTPIGWSPDGKYIVLGHETCDSSAPAQGWRGQIQVVEFASGHVAATIPNAQGEIAFSPDGGSIAAQAGADLEVADLDSGEPQTIPGVRFLGWLDQESVFLAAGSKIEFADLDPLEISTASYSAWKTSSPGGLQLAVDSTGAVRAVLAADGSTLLDLSSAGLAAERYPAPDDPVVTYLQPAWWSPDGSMLALESADGTSIALLSVA